MLHTKCRDIGTSKGVIIPTSILNYAHITTNDTLDIEYLEESQTIVIKKSNNSVREGWSKQFKQFMSNGHNELLIPDIFEDEDLHNETI